jgi:hypothetical protein
MISLLLTDCKSHLPQVKGISFTPGRDTRVKIVAGYYSNLVQGYET